MSRYDLSRIFVGPGYRFRTREGFPEPWWTVGLGWSVCQQAARAWRTT